MPEPTYLAAVLAVGVSVTVAMRAAPFAVKNALRDSVVLKDVSRWMPLGAIAILAAYCLFRVPQDTSTHGVAEIAGVVATVGIHLWRKNLVMSLVTGTAVCVAVSTWL